MADEDTPSAALTGAPPPGAAPGTGADTPRFARGADSDETTPNPERAQSPVTTQESQAHTRTLNDLYDQVNEQDRRNKADEAKLYGELQALQAQLSRPRPKEPAPIALPAPPTQEDKNQVVGLLHRLLNWGTLIGLAFAVSRRSHMRSTIFKQALGAGLQGYYDGQREQQKEALALWERNRQFIQQQNRDQHQMYKDNWENAHLSDQEHMELFKAQAEMWRNHRAMDAANRQNRVDIARMLQDGRKVIVDSEKAIRADRKEWYRFQGLTQQEGDEYRDWVKRIKHGPDVSLIDPNDVDKWHEIEKKYPRDEFVKWLMEQQDKREAEKTTVRTRAEREEKRRQDLIDAQGGAAGNRLELAPPPSGTPSGSSAKGGSPGNPFDIQDSGR